MEFFDGSRLGESALDAFLADPSLQDLWFQGTDREQLQRLLAARAAKAEAEKPKKQVEEEPPAEDGDALLRVKLSPDEMKAWVVLLPLLEGADAKTLEEVIQDALYQEGISFGVHNAQIARLCRRPIFGKGILVAQGVYPQEGKEGAVHFTFDTQISVKPDAKAGYTFPVENPGFAHLAQKGELLCVISGASHDFTGRTVKGRKVYPQNSGVDKVIPGENVRVSPEGEELYALIEGEATLRDGVLSVFPVMELENVDMGTGDIKFGGSVYVKGTIKSGWTVEAAGNVVVGGHVESCRIVAGGHLVVNGGIKGADHSFLQIGGSVRTPFVEFMDLHVGGDLYSDVLMGSEVVCEGGIYVLGRRGRILGGKCTAREIVVNELGNHVGTHTAVEISSLQALYVQQLEMKKKLADWERRKSGMSQLIEETGNEAKQKVLNKVYTQIVDEISQLYEQQDTVQREIDVAHAKYSFDIRVYTSLFPKVAVTILGNLWNNERRFSKSRLYAEGTNVIVSANMPSLEAYSRGQEAN